MNDHEFDQLLRDQHDAFMSEIMATSSLSKPVAASRKGRMPFLKSPNFYVRRVTWPVVVAASIMAFIVALSVPDAPRGGVSNIDTSEDAAQKPILQEISFSAIADTSATLDLIVDDNRPDDCLINIHANDILENVTECQDQNIIYVSNLLPDFENSIQLEVMARGKLIYDKWLTVTTTPSPTTSPPVAGPPPSPTLVWVELTVSNLVTNGPTRMREDRPAYLSTATANGCQKRGCALPGTDLTTGAMVKATCVTSGDRTTNGDAGDPADDANPQRYESTRWYGIRWPDGRMGYLSEVWIRQSDRGTHGLPSC